MGNGNFKHDPGAAGESGEGDSTIVQFCLLYCLVIAILVHKKYFSKKDEEPEGLEEAAAEAAQKAAQQEAGGEGAPQKTKEELDDEVAQAKWTRPAQEFQLSDASRVMFCKVLSCGMSSGEDNKEGFLWRLSGVNWLKVLLFFGLLWCLWLFLLALSLMGTGFKLLGGKDSAGMFDVVDNPISGLMVGILITVLVQSSSTSTSLIITLVGADELSVSNAVPMVMGANIGTSVTNTIVAMGHFANPNDLRRGFAAATVHDLFNLLSVAILLPLNWATTFLEEMTYAMAKDADACDKSTEDCESQDFLKPYIKPYVSSVASYDKNVAKYVSQNYCMGQCSSVTASTTWTDPMGDITKLVCKKDADGDTDCGGIGAYRSWVKDNKLISKRAPLYIYTDSTAAFGSYHTKCPEGNATACASTSLPLLSASMSSLQPNTLYKTCETFKTGLCDKRLLKGGLMLEDWELSDDAAGVMSVLFSIAALCCCLFLIVFSLQILIKGVAARLLQKALAFNGYLSMFIGLVITLLVQSSSITTSTLTPLCAVGIISLEQMFPLTLGANIGTTITGIIAASVVTSNPVAAWQVALCHLFFNIFGILIWYPAPVMRNVPLNGARWLGRMTSEYGAAFPLIYTSVVFFAIPAVCYGIAFAATS